MSKEYLEIEKKYIEDTEKLRTEIKDLKELIKLNDLIDKQNYEQSRNKVQVETYADIVKKSPGKEKIIEREYNCMECCFQGTEESELNRHVNLKHVSPSNSNNQPDCTICGERFTMRRNLDKHMKDSHIGVVSTKCKRCGETFTSNNDLNDHIQSKHVEQEIRKLGIRDEEFMTGSGVMKQVNSKHTEGQYINCRICSQQFTTKRSLMEHRKIMHIESVAHCRNNLQGNCPYTDEKCFWNHNKETKENVKCFICAKSFENKNEMMKHRKREHFDIVKPCFQYSQNTCRFKDILCWFKHEEENKNSDNMNVDFREVSEDLDPPIAHQAQN